MKTLAQIKTEIIKISAGQPITRSNYDYFADQVIPRGDPLKKLNSISPEFKVYQDAQHQNTNDWLDMACFRAAISQTKFTTERSKP